MAILSLDNFSKLMAELVCDFPQINLSCLLARPLAVAVSGGADSLCLTLLLHKWCASFSCSLTALTVDHGLRSGSQNEAQQVGAWMKALNIPHKILTWQGPKPTSRIQEKAREARYSLMENWCLEQGIQVLATAHHADDQVETVLQRLARGSGVAGLCGISPCVQKPFGHIIRPFLSVPKSALVATLNQWPHPFITDPSNNNLAFDRVRWRSLSPQLAALGLTPSSVLRTIRRFRQCDLTLEILTSDFLKTNATLSFLGCAFLSLSSWAAQPTDIRHRALKRLISCIGGKPYSPSYESIDHLDALLLAPSFSGHTVGGCYFFFKGSGVMVVKEGRFFLAAQPYYSGMRWDNRFTLTFVLPENSTIQAIGLKRATALARRCKTHPSILASLPGIYDHSGLLYFIPHFPCEESGFFQGNVNFTPTQPLTLP